MSDYKIEVEQVVSEDTEKLIPNETDVINMNTPEDSDTEIEVSKNEIQVQNDNENKIRSVLELTNSSNTSSSNTSNIEYLSKDKFETILGEMRKDMLQVVNVAQIATTKSEQNENEIERLRRLLVGYENTINVLKNNIRQLANELRDVTQVQRTNSKNIKDDFVESNLSDVEEEETNEESNEESNEETEQGITEITDSQSSKRAKTFKITPKRKLSNARDVIGNLVEKKDDRFSSSTEKSGRSKRSSRKNNESDNDKSLTPQEYRRRRRRY